MTAVLDTNKGLTDQYRQTIMAALPRGVEPSEEFWRDLETAVAGFLLLQERRTRRPPKLELKRWQKIDRLVSELGSELRTVKRQTPWSAIDPLWPNRSLSALWPIKLRAELGVLCYQSLTGAFRGSSNPHRAYLYGVVCDLWHQHLGQKLKFWRTGEGVPRGALIDFFVACVGPVLGDATPTVHGFGTIIDRERRRLSYFFDRKK